MQTPIKYMNDEFPDVLPQGVHVAYTPVIPITQPPLVDSDGFSVESRRVMHALANRAFGHVCQSSCELGPLITFAKEPGGRPVGTLRQGIPVSVSITHTRDTLAVVISDDFYVGIDVEPTNRIVHDGLQRRMRHPDENLELDAIRIWTIKEAVLKLTGTGLRTPMNQLKICRVSDELFQVHHADFEFSVVSLCHQSNWVSIAWQQR